MFPNVPVDFLGQNKNSIDLNDTYLRLGNLPHTIDQEPDIVSLLGENDWVSISLNKRSDELYRFYRYMIYGNGNRSCTTDEYDLSTGVWLNVSATEGLDAFLECSIYFLEFQTLVE